ncbi:MAG: c-type cytochrome [Chloroflexi bacterium]|nr:c-type cytochrome [Chloroflexota bacterium]
MKKDLATNHARLVATGFLVAALLAGGCAPSAPKQTIGQSAEAGRRIFLEICSTCHGKQGLGAFGPALIGENATLEKFLSAQRLFDYISIAMPLEAPGTLKRDEYLQVLSYLLVQNGFADAESPFDPDQLEQYPLKK